MKNFLDSSDIANEIGEMFRSERSLAQFINVKTLAPRADKPAVAPAHTERAHPPVMREKVVIGTDGESRRLRTYRYN